MNFELSTNQESENRQRAFDLLFQSVLKKQRQDTVPTVVYDLPYPKEEFLGFIVDNKNVLLHGSNNQNLEILEPRQANDAAKKSGNKNAVYAVTDPVFPIFFAILDRNNPDNKGIVESERIIIDQETKRLEYKFKIPKNAGKDQLWTRGVVYIFDKGQFNPERDDDGELSGEWTSETSVKPIAKLEVGPEDFRYMDKIEYQR